MRRKIGIQSVDLFFSAQCNMNCEYCYIPKSKRLHHTNNELRDALSVDQMAKAFLDIENDAIEIKLENLSLWGAEPTINADKAELAFENWFSEHSNIRDLRFSTNTLLGSEPILNMIKAANSKSEKLEEKRLNRMFVQLSLDGPEWITDSSRHPGATKKIIKAWKDLLVALEDESLYSNINKVTFAFKPTLSPENFKEMTGNKDKLIEWFKFFDDIYDLYINSKLNKDKVKSFPAAITIINIGSYTSEDGRVFAEFLKEVYSIDPREEEIKHYKQPLFFQGMQNLDKILLHNERTVNKSHETTCGGGDGGMAIGFNNDLYPCHRGFGLKYYKDDKDYSMKEKNLKNSLSADISSETDRNRLFYHLRGYHDFMLQRVSFVTAAAKRMALYNQASKRFLDDEHFCKAFAMYVTSMGCFLDIAEKTTSVNLPSLSFVRYWGNGAFEEMYKAWYRSRIKGE